MRSEEVKIGMSTNAGGEEETSTVETGDWGIGTGRTFAGNTISCNSLLRSDRLLLACTNSFVLLSAAMIVVQQEVFRAVVIEVEPKFVSS